MGRTLLYDETSLSAAPRQPRPPSRGEAEKMRVLMGLAMLEERELLASESKPIAMMDRDQDKSPICFDQNLFAA